MNAGGRRPPLVFFFPGQGSHFAGMGLGLYGADSGFRSIVDECWALLRSLPSTYPTLLPSVEVDVTDVTELWAGPPSHWLSPLALFTVEWAVSQRLIGLGIQPTAVCGHSLGHYVAATLAGVLTLPRALIMLLRRSHLLHTMEGGRQERGTMLSISAPLAKVQAMIKAGELGVEVAGVNSPTNTVVAGSVAGVEAVQAECQRAGVRAVKVHTSHAFHSAYIDHILPAYTDTLHSLASTDIPSLLTLSTSNPPCLLADTVTGQLIDPKEFASADTFSVHYWVRHTRREVRFEEAVTALTSALNQAQVTSTSSRATPMPVMGIEMGPGRTCVTLLQQTIDAREVGAAPALAHIGLQSLAGFTDVKGKGEKGEDRWHWMDAVGRVWERGVEVEWGGLWELEGVHNGVRKVSLPLYPFDHSTLHCPPRARPVPAVTQARGLTLTLPTSYHYPAVRALTSPTSTLSPSPSPLSPSPSPLSPYPSPSPSSPSSSPTPTPPVTLSTITSLVLSAFSSTLGLPLPSLTPTTDFFTAGGDSVSAVALTAELNRTCGLQGRGDAMVRTATLLVHSTVGELSGVVYAAVTKGQQGGRVVEVRGEDKGVAVDTRVRLSPSPPLSPISPLPPSSPSPSPSPDSASAFTYLPRQLGPLFVLQWGTTPFPPSSPSPYLPLILIHAVGGDILSYRALTAHLSPHQAVFAFRATSLDGGVPPLTSIPALARQYLDVLMAEEGPFRGYWKAREGTDPFSRTLPLPDGARPSTPTPPSPPTSPGGMHIALGGHSFGGLVAYEMACQLQARRRHHQRTTDAEGRVGGGMDLVVDKLVLIDTPSPDSLPPRLTEQGVLAYIPHQPHPLCSVHPHPHPPGVRCGGEHVDGASAGDARVQLGEGEGGGGE